MSRKPKFKPVITRIKLNPEQAVLSCNCYDTRVSFFNTLYWNPNAPSTMCQGSYKSKSSSVIPGACGASGSSIAVTYSQYTASS